MGWHGAKRRPAWGRAFDKDQSTDWRI